MDHKSLKLKCSVIKYSNLKTIKNVFIQKSKSESNLSDIKSTIVIVDQSRAKNKSISIND